MQVDPNQPVILPEAPRLEVRIQEERKRARRNEELRLAEDARRRRAQREENDRQSKRREKEKMTLVEGRSRGKEKMSFAVSKPPDRRDFNN